MSASNAVNYEKEIPEVYKTMIGVHHANLALGFDRTLAHLVHIRASQINHCAHCIKMHTKEARDHGETNERLDRIIVWRHVNDFTDREKAALAWTEALTNLYQEADLDVLRTELRKYFSEREIGLLTNEVAMINFWNRFGVARH
ncbi:MAG: carboxymuconolactone decarboxylase family protein [Pseudomonadota bacterium]